MNVTTIVYEKQNIKKTEKTDQDTLQSVPLMRRLRSEMLLVLLCYAEDESWGPIVLIFVMDRYDFRFLRFIRVQEDYCAWRRSQKTMIYY